MQITNNAIKTHDSIILFFTDHLTIATVNVILTVVKENTDPHSIIEDRRPDVSNDTDLFAVMYY